MGCTSSQPVDKDALTRTKAIDQQIKKDKHDARKQVNILLLGAGESGKSTVLKQMKLLYDGEYNDQERMAYREIIFSNTVQCMVVVLQSLEKLDLTLQPENEQYIPTILDAKSEQMEGDYMAPELARALTSLWHDPVVSSAVKRGKEIQLNDSATYLFDGVERFATPGYLPTNQDILRSRVRTTGITETRFHVQGFEYKVLDVGGQRSERRKWIHCFENVEALIFIVSLSEYDQMLLEDETVNRMAEALTLFEAVVNSRWFVKSSIILFLNKIDLLKEKLGTSPIKAYFPEYKGSDDGSESDFAAACDHFKKRFMALNQNHKMVIPHLTCATDSRQIKVVIQGVDEHILKTNLEQVGFA